MKKITMLNPVQYRTKPTQSDIFGVQFWTQTINAWMLIPVLVCSMPTPSYDYSLLTSQTVYLKNFNFQNGKKITDFYEKNL